MPAGLGIGVIIMATSACAGQCGARGGLPPPRPPLVTGADGQKYHVLDKGAYKAFYDRWGRLSRLEYDSNGDGRPDVVAEHGGRKTPQQIAVDENFDGRMDRWERYDSEGKLEKVGLPSKGGSAPDVWSTTDAQGQVVRKEYDTDTDGRMERVESFVGGRLVKVEIDSDRDGRLDRWQQWQGGRMTSEGLDTDRDGRPDRLIRYGERGRVTGLEAIGGS